MAKKNAGGDPVVEKLEALLWVTQDLFILQALLAGVNAGDVRKMARVNTDRVSNISKYLKRAKGN
jgi:hypothetical protein